MPLDFLYLERWSVFLDLTILVKTVPAVFTRRGVATAGEHTPAAIAELLGLPVGTIHSRLARGLEDLRGLEKEHDVERA